MSEIQEFDARMPVADIEHREEQVKQDRMVIMAPKMYQMLKCILKRRAIPESWKSHYQDLEDLMKSIDGE